MKRAGHQFVGVGVGAIIFDAKGKVFLAKRGQEASNDQGLWAWPGGEVEFGETLSTAIQRELLEEFEIVSMTKDHIFPYRISDYVRYRYVKVWYFRWIPQPLFRWLERHFGWHLCITARVRA